ncbi:MAG TPA: ABC transporter permease [Verrucomicrobiae bacterium]|nr:ABC transporter permease [Verrucomicrobiae bacterium]
MTSLLQDIQYSWRLIAKAPGFAALAILTLALGIGANTTIFSWINWALLNPVPGVAKPGEILSLTQGKQGDTSLGFSYPDLEALRDGQKSFSGITGAIFAPMSLTSQSKPERIWGMVATANYFDVLGVRPILGRGFLPEEDEKPGGAPVAVISYRLWQRNFGGRADIVGQSIEINRQSYTIVGVTPPEFRGSQTGMRFDIWVPVMMVAQVMPGNDMLHDHHTFWLFAFGRLKPGVKPETAQEEMTLLLKREAKNYPEEHRGHDSVTVYPLWRNPFSVNFFFALLLPILMTIAGLVLLLACANVANLMLVRSVGRRREIAIRMSLGASRWRLVRQLLVESLMLALGGGGVALLITLWTSGTLTKFMPPMDFPLSLDVQPDRTVLLATLVISALTGVIFGILPALRASSVAPVSVLKEETGTASGGPRKARLASGLVVAQISLSVLLLICAGLFIRSFLSAQFIQTGFNAHNVAIASFDLFTAGYSEAGGAEFDRQLVAKIETLPGVQSAALTTRLPGLGPDSTRVTPEGYVLRGNESMETPVAVVTPNFFRTLQISLVEGRDFTLEDTPGAQRAIIVNEAFVNRYWPKQEALGKRVKSDLTNEWFTVVGVASDCKMTGLTDKPVPFVYLPLYQVYRPAVIGTARVNGNPLAFAGLIEKTIHAQNAGLAVFDGDSLESNEQINSFPQRIAGTFVGAFGLLALVLAAVGIYGVTAYTTRQRTHEIGIRMVLGASKEEILRLVLGRGFRLTLAGVALGLFAALGLTRYLSGLLLGVKSTDLFTFSIVAILLCGVALVACLVPARRAMRVDPMVALRHE